MQSKFRHVALIGKYKTPEVAEPVMRLARFLETRGVKVLLDRLTALNLIAWVREPGAIHVTVAADAARLLR